MIDDEENQPDSSDANGISRRTIAKGAAWAIPVIAMGATVPTAVASPQGAPTPPCVTALTNDSINWVVDNVRYAESGHTCNSYDSHRDVRLTFEVLQDCEHDVTVQVRNVVGNSVWCAWSSQTLYLLKTSPAGSGLDLTFPATGDRPTNINNGYVSSSCNITAYESANDGMHINPCAPGGPYFEYRYSTDYSGSVATATWSAWFGWGDVGTVPLPPS